LAPDRRLELCKYGLWRPTRAPPHPDPATRYSGLFTNIMQFSKGVLKRA
jgi:hypothetical protein